MRYCTVEENGYSGNIYCADVFDLLNKIGPESADIVFLDPPFNLGKRYSETLDLDNKPEEEYQYWLKRVIDLSIIALKPGGALYIYHLPAWAIRFGAYVDQSLIFRHWISVSMKNGFARGLRLYPAHYALLYFTKGAPQQFIRPKINPLRCRKCGEFVRDYGGYRSIIEEKGINLSDIWDDLSPVRHGNKKHRRPNELPIGLFNRVLSISGAPGMMYVDPFAGSGAGAVAALKNEMNFIVGDILPENTKIISERLSGAFTTQESVNG